MDVDKSHLYSFSLIANLDRPVLALLVDHVNCAGSKDVNPTHGFCARVQYYGSQRIVNKDRTMCAPFSD